MKIRTRGDDLAVHRPVVVLAEGQAVGGMVVAGLSEGDEVGGVDEGDVAGGRKLDPQAAGGALVVVDFEDLAAERGRAAVFEFVICDFGRWEWRHRTGSRPKQERGMVGEVAGDEGFAHFPAILGDGDEEFETVGEPGEYLADVADERLGLQGFDSGGSMPGRLPEAILAKVEKRIFRAVLIIMFPDDFEPCRESVPQLPAPWDAVGGGYSLVNHVQNRQKQERFVRPLMAFASDADHSDVEVVKSFDGGIE